MDAAKGAELLQLQPLGLGLLVLGLAVVLALALGALQCNDLTHNRSLQSREFRIQNALSATPEF
jgi:hypothetical protein